MEQIEIFKIPASGNNGHSLKLCAVNFDRACTLKDDIQTDFFNIIWIKEGNSTYHIDFKTYTIPSESIFFLSPGQVFHVESEQIKTGYRLAFSEDFYCIETHAKETACNGLLFNNIYEIPFISPTQEQKSELEGMVQKMFFEFRNPGVAQSEMLLAYLRLLLVQCTRIKMQQAPNTLVPVEENHELVAKFSQLLEKHFKEKHSVSDYADLMNLAPKSLSKKIQKVKGRSPSDLIRERLILEAKRELHYSDKSVKEVAFDLGFEDPAYFTRFFKKSAQITPQGFKSSLTL